MGFGRYAMPLLSTLAALVIIVHSMEEETEYRRELRPRALDTGTHSYEEPWRSDKAEPMMQQVTRAENWDDDASETLKHRKPVRKRKRRPIASDEQFAEDRRLYREPGLYQKDNSDVEEMPRRRRRKPEAKLFDDNERPLRRRKKRPHYWPNTDENDRLNVRRHLPPISEINIENDFHKDIDDNVHRDNFKHNDFGEEASESIIKANIDSTPKQTYENINIQTNDENSDNGNEQYKEASDVSSEVINQETFDNNNTTTTSNDQNDKPLIIKELEKAKRGGPIDPMTLKEILKKTNGTSLSEILQQHNLSLADLLNGKVNSLSVKKKEIKTATDFAEETSESKYINILNTQTTNHDMERKTLKESVIEYGETTESLTDSQTEITSANNENFDSTTPQMKELPKLSTKRRFPPRRKLRMRPTQNNSYKGQLSRDMMALGPQKYINRGQRHFVKAEKWRDILPSNITTSNETISDENEETAGNVITTTTTTTEATTTVISDEEQTTILNYENYNPSTEIVTTQFNISTNEKDDKTNVTTSVPQETIIIISTTPVEEVVTITQRPIVTPVLRPDRRNSSVLRRQSFNNRQRKKRLRQKSSTTESPQDDSMNDLLGITNLVSASDIISRMQTPDASSLDRKEITTALEDFITTERSRKGGRYSTKAPLTSRAPPVSSTTEETAKFEIEEILNDTRTSARLSKILLERNMTLTELVEHRERGSSNVHLADIFHNASREPNPLEPFLSKSLLEPISKETYPLRALLEANLHDPKATTLEPSTIEGQYLNIPIVMNFGNNVNENGENMGIMSFFNNLTNGKIDLDKNILNTDSDGQPYKSTVIEVGHEAEAESNRESRVLNENKNGMISWNDIITLMQTTSNNSSDEIKEGFTKELQPSESYNKITLEEDIDGDGLIVLEDLQHIKEFDNNIAASDEKMQVTMNEHVDSPIGILDKVPSSTKSVAIATASIVGLALLLFLLTYVTIKWRQQRKLLRMENHYSDGRIPTPVFENRKGHKHNSSTRSISPMLSSNIYSMNTLDSHGKESPEYMWDTLRKPFQ